MKLNTGPRKFTGSFFKPEKTPKKLPRSSEGISLTDFFNEQRPKMQGTCCNCGKPSSKFSDDYFHFSIAHILPKKPRAFPSVATNKDNWIELCAFGTESCHSRFDSNWEKAQLMKCWPVAVEKFKLVYPFLTAEEKRRVPDCLIQELEPEEYEKR